MVFGEVVRESICQHLVRLGPFRFSKVKENNILFAKIVLKHGGLTRYNVGFILEVVKCVGWNLVSKSLFGVVRST